MKSCQIRHTYGEDEDENRMEAEAICLAENAVWDGLGGEPTVPGSPAVAAPETAIVTIGGKKCKWCGSSTHARRNHKDCPQNPKNAASSM